MKPTDYMEDLINLEIERTGKTRGDILAFWYEPYFPIHMKYSEKDKEEQRNASFSNFLKNKVR